MWLSLLLWSLLYALTEDQKIMLLCDTRLVLMQMQRLAKRCTKALRDPLTKTRVLGAEICEEIETQVLPGMIKMAEIAPDSSNLQKAIKRTTDWTRLPVAAPFPNWAIDINDALTDFTIELS